jgi:hypothetical protein
MKYGTLQKSLEWQLQKRKHKTIYRVKRRKTSYLPRMLEQDSRPRKGMVIEMESFNANSARSFLGKHVNLHLKDGAVIINVQLTAIHKGSGKKNNMIEYGLKNRKATRIPLRNIAWAEMLNTSLIKNPI